MDKNETINPNSDENLELKRLIISKTSSNVKLGKIYQDECKDHQNGLN